MGLAGGSVRAGGALPHGHRRRLESFPACRLHGGVLRRSGAESAARPHRRGKRGHRSRGFRSQRQVLRLLRPHTGPGASAAKRDSARHVRAMEPLLHVAWLGGHPGGADAAVPPAGETAGVERPVVGLAARHGDGSGGAGFHQPLPGDGIEGLPGGYHVGQRARAGACGLPGLFSSGAQGKMARAGLCGRLSVFFRQSVVGGRDAIGAGHRGSCPGDSIRPFSEILGRAGAGLETPRGGRTDGYAGGERRSVGGIELLEIRHLVHVAAAGHHD